MHLTKSRSVLAILAVTVIGIAGVWTAGVPEATVGVVPEATPELTESAALAEGASRLVSIQEFPVMDGCEWVDPANLNLSSENPIAALEQRGGASFLTASLRQQGQGMPQGGRGGPAEFNADRQSTSTHRRTLADTYPTFTAIGVNSRTNEVILQDNNLWSAYIFNRTENTPPRARFSEPKRVIIGDQTEMQFNNGLYIDPVNGDMYSVESDTGDKMVVFAHDAGGNVAPKRILNTPHRVYSVAIDEVREELYITVEYPPEVVVYNKNAEGDEEPLRRIVGDRTQLETPHGIAVDSERGLLYVNNWGHATDFADSRGGTTGSEDNGRNISPVGDSSAGRFNPSSITIYSVDARGDAAPIRVIEGDRTQLNWPGNMTVNQETGDLYVANDMDHSILVFTGLDTADGNVGPTRVIKGDRTKLVHPTGLAVDTVNQELWVSNLGNASGVAFPLEANGNVAPVRVVRAAPEEHQSLIFGRTAAVTYDPNREEILVPN